MTITIKIAHDGTQWDDLLARAPFRTIFHTWEWLKIVEKHTKTKLYPIIGFKGTNPIGIFPVFYQKKGFKLIFSPPSAASVLYLGPLIIDYEKMKQSKRELILFQFLKAVDDFIFSELKANYVRIRCSPGFLDSRPFRWIGYNVEPGYTLMIDLSKGLDAVWENFDKEPRRHIEMSSKEGVSVEEGSVEDLDFLHSSINRRFKEQGLESNVSKSYLYDLFESFFPQNLRIFIAKYKGEKIGGGAVLCYNNKVSAWFGTPRIDLKGISQTDLVHWESIKWAKENGFQYYELMDAGYDPRLSAYKSKFNPDLSVWFSATKHSSSMIEAAEKFYKLFRKAW